MALAVAACALVGGGLSTQEALATKGPRLIHGHSAVSVGCAPGAAYTVRARVGVRMTVANRRGRGTWADRMEARARLESITPGLRHAGAWRSVTTRRLTAGTRYAPIMRVRTDTVSANARWRLHVTLIWRRPAPVRDITQNLYLPFTGSCIGAGGAAG